MFYKLLVLSLVPNKGEQIGKVRMVRASTWMGNHTDQGRDRLFQRENKLNIPDLHTLGNACYGSHVATACQLPLDPTRILPCQARLDFSGVPSIAF